MPVRKVLLIGGSGFVGGWLASRLSAAGIRVTIPTRRRENRKGLLLLPTVFEVQADVNDPQALMHLVEGADAVINLVGILHDRDDREPYGAAFQSLPLTAFLAMARSYNPDDAETTSVWALPRSLATTGGIILYFLFLRVLRCFSSPRSPPAPAG